VQERCWLIPFVTSYNSRSGVVMAKSDRSTQTQSSDSSILFFWDEKRLVRLQPGMTLYETNCQVVKCVASIDDP